MSNIKELNIKFDKDIKTFFIIELITLISSVLCFLFYVFRFSNNNLLICFSISGFMFFLSAVFVVFKLKLEKKLLNKKLEKLEYKDKYEFDKILLYYEGEYVFTKNKVFLLKNDVSFKYEDILLVYKKYSISGYFKLRQRHNQLLNSLKEDWIFIVILKNGKAVRLSYNKELIHFYNESYSSLESLLVSKNKEILVGNTDENFKKLEEKYPKIDRQKLKAFNKSIDYFKISI